MREVIEKRKASGKTFKFVPIVLCVLSVIMIIIGLYGGFAILIMAAIITSLIYVNKYGAMNKNQKWLAERKYGHIPDTFRDSDPVYPKSKVRCGQFALMNNGTMVMIPYTEIAWTYMHITRLYGIIPISKSTMVLCRDGRSFQLPCGKEELQEILRNHILLKNPNVLVGFTPENQKAYKALVAAYKAQNVH